MRRLLKTAYMALVYLFFYAPIAVLVAFSFNASKYGASWKGFTLDWYSALFERGQILDAAENSLLVAGLSATAATVLGTLVAIALDRYRFRGRLVLRTCLFVVMMSPDIVMGVSLLALFLALRMEPGFSTLFLAHVTFCLPFVAVTVSSRLKGFDPHLMEAARDLGAGEYETFRHVVLPLLAPAVAAGWLLSFTLSLDDVVVSFFTTGPDFEILPLRIYSMVKVGVQPVVNALSAVMVLATVVVVLVSHLLLGDKK